MVLSPWDIILHSYCKMAYVGWLQDGQGELCFNLLTAAEGKSSPTKKLEVQLEQPATAMAAGRGPWLKSSATINQGMGPGPISKKATNIKIAPMQIKLIQLYESYGRKERREVNMKASMTRQDLHSQRWALTHTEKPLFVLGYNGVKMWGFWNPVIWSHIYHFYWDHFINGKWK